MTTTKVRLVRGDTDGEEVYAYQLPDGSILQPTVQVDVAGNPIEAATETTMAELKGVADAISTAAAAIQAAVEALNAKAVAIDTGDITGTVSADTGLLQPLTDEQLRATAVPVSGPLTDNQLRATAVPVDTGLTQGITNSELRENPVPISAPSLPLPSGAATDAMVAAIRDMEDTLVTQLQAIAGKFPRLTKEGITEVAASAPAGFVSVASYPGGYNTLTCVDRIGTQFSGNLQHLHRIHEPFQMSNMGALHLYNGITIS